MKHIHCKGCVNLHNAGRKNPTAGLEKFNNWCCLKGQPAHKAIAWCKTHNKKILKTNS